MPSEPSELRRRPLTGLPGAPRWWIVGLASIALVLTTIAVVRHRVLIHLDDAVSDRMKDWDLRHSWGKPLIYLLTWPGQRGVVLIASGLVVGYLWWRTRSVETLLRWLVALASVAVVVYAFKAAVAREAPSAVAGRPGPADSYPSGHVVNAVVIWGTLAWCAGRAEVARWLPRTLRLLAVLGPIAVIVGMTLLDYHWWSDFLAGLCIGIVLLPLTLAPWWATLATRLDRRWPGHQPVSDPPLVTTPRQ